MAAKLMKPIKHRGKTYIAHGLFSIEAIAAARLFARNLREQGYRAIIRPRAAGLVIYSNGENHGT